MKTKIKLVFIFSIFFFLSAVYAQNVEISNGPIPTLKQEKTNVKFESDADLVSAGYGYSSTTQSILSASGPCAFDFLALWPTSDYLSSMCQGGDGKYYVTGTNSPSLYQLDTVNVSFVLLGNITGMGADKPNGISYNPVNSNYYIASSSNLFSFNVNSRVATLIGPFNTGGIMIDLCFDENGICYAYDIVTDAAYTINISIGVATLLGPLGYDANFGQGMSYDFDTQTIYLTAFNNSTYTGQCRIMDQVTGNTTLISDWGLEQIDAFALKTLLSPPCPVGAPSNPNPPNGTTGVPLTGNTLNWTNGVGTTNIELWFGPAGNVVKVYDGPVITSFALPTLNYYTIYRWYIMCKDDSCGTQGPTWSFTTMQDPNLLYETIDVYPLNINYWTGTCNSSTKTEVSLINAISAELGWMVFDISPIINNAQIFEVEFHGYLYMNNWPYWSITPMGNINSVTASAYAIYDQISTHYEQGVAYSYNQESGTLTNGWITRELGNGAINDMENSLLLNNYFAVGIVDFDFSSSYYVGFQGWAETNQPFLRVKYEYCLSYPISPSNLTAQVIYSSGPQVQLNWQDNSSNESGFKIFRKYGYPNDPGNYELIGTVQLNTTQFLDDLVTPDSTYTYIVFAFNGCGPSEESNTTTIAIPVPVELISFTSEIDDNIVTLFWQTATETNNSGFEILRFAQNDNGNWERIGFVVGKGTTTEIQSYSFTDKPESGLYKYRLKQIDYDGTFAYSPEVEAEVKAPNVFSLEQNYPNPFNPNTVISYQLPVTGNVSLKVFDILGNEVATLVNQEQEPGVYKIEFSTSSGIRNQVSGIYFYQLKAGSFIETKKMILLK